MQKIGQGNYTKEQITDVLHGKNGTVEYKFRYDHLNKGEQKIGTFEKVMSGEVSMNAFAEIKRTGRFTIEDDETVDWLNDRIQPFVMVKMPDGNFAEWSQGIFLMSSPKRVERYGKVIREIEAYDGLKVVKDDKFDSRYYITLGTNYVTAVIDILQGAGITKYNIEQTTAVLQTTREWEPGTPKLDVINELLAEIAYTQLWVDEYGFYTSAKYRLPSERAVEYTYADNDLSVTYNGAIEEEDLFNAPNKWVITKSNPESEPLTSVYTNENPNSKTSTVSRGRTIVDYRPPLDNIADQASLDAYALRLAFEASQVFGHVNFETSLMPFHSYNDCLEIIYSGLALNDKYTESSWNMPLDIHGKMRHDVRKVVQI